ncbi:sulfotransferase family protein [Pedobacter sp. AJM]|jgi:hypothetical protein|uniref:sulfotransferase family protein n=1 Tax=Pedobacter sp. AJM TaxID=2003629 RepID=UPI000B4AE12C|nr:sulfotransferase family protein [Pedobacter sp. AJM]OWK68728.1 hypothetical protein CBW18_20625 [Pedobacter sp. AJM]
MNESHLKHWIPYQLNENEGNYSCRWLYTNGVPFTGPFFNESINKCLSHPYNSNAFKPSTDLSVLPEWSSALNSIAPTAFIFHVSRCGSTLISQSLCLNNHHIVLPEVPFIDELLRLNKNRNWSSPLNREELIKAVIKIYGQTTEGLRKHLFIKTDSWHIHFMPLLRKLYPHVPFILLYRKPDEVMRSHQKLRGMQAVPGVIPNELLGIENEKISPADFDGHTIKVLENYFKAFILASQQDPMSLLLNYNEGIINMMQRFCRFTGVELNKADWAQIETRSGFNAKYPDQVFHEEQPDEAIPVYQQQAFNFYHELEELRKAQIANT